MANLRFVSTSTVQAVTNKDASGRIELTQCELKLLLIGAIQKGLLFLRPEPDQEDQTLLIQHLKTSLSRTLDFFTPLAGRLATVEHVDNTISYFIDCNNEGAQFVHAVADGATIADILEPVFVPPIVRSFFPLNGVLNYEGVTKPLLAIQVTELDDGIFVGCTMNHSVADGTSFWNFFNSWSDICRGLNHISKLPVFECWSSLHGKVCPPIRFPISTIKNNSATFVPPPLQERVFHFTKEKLAGLKAKANSEVETKSISSLQSLLAHIWRSVIRNRQIEIDKEVGLPILAELRGRLPELPENYFGYAVVPAGIVTLKARDILEHGIGYVALQINKVVSSCTEDKARSILEYFLENPGPVLKINGFALDHILFISSSPRFNVYGTDFGWGRPLAVRSGPEKESDGKITFFPGKEEGSVDIQVCISPETLESMGNDSEFMDAVAV